ncbi:hypothetical protein [Hyalangium gracile]|uniref:hypothetical protein n=1 Tax=Hyalangium gracile TaxID=394092 RepID=UPI001CCAD9B3|nr:hypothetical protein [Hyalangium gracile]
MLSEDYSFVYQYAGASGQVGAMLFGTEDDEGEWSVKHDVLTLTGQKRTRRYLMPGYLAWSLYPGAISRHGELYIEKNRSPR